MSNKLTESDIKKAASDIIAEEIARGNKVCLSWASAELIAKMGNIEGEGEPFFAIAGDFFAWKTCKSIIQKMDVITDAVNNKQMQFEGFGKLQEAYSVKREGQIWLVPTCQLTQQEREDRADMYEKFSEALIAHARELRNYQPPIELQ